MFKLTLRLISTILFLINYFGFNEAVMAQDIPNDGIMASAQSTTVFLPVIMNYLDEDPNGNSPIYLGVYINPEISFDNYAQDIQKFEDTVGKKHAIYHFYTSWPESDFNTGHRHLLDRIIQNGSTPMISFMSVPGVGDVPLGCGDPDWNLDSILRGDHDQFLAEYANDLRSYGNTIFIRWGHEMNLIELSWAGSCNGNDPTKFINAYQHIQNIFDQAGADNIQWIWAPNYASHPPETWNEYQNYYPGDEYVDWIGPVGYNWGASDQSSNFEWDSFVSLFDPILKDIATRYPDKPVMISDYASAEDDGGDKAAWITETLEAVQTYPNLQAIVWFNYVPLGTDYQFIVDSSPDSLAAYQQAIRSERFSSDAPY